MTTKPFFSVITVTRNNLRGLKKTYKSILSQICDDYEWIVIDGASTDGTSDFLNENCYNWISEPDKGIYDAMNKGIDRASGDYLIFMNAGDCFAMPKTLDYIKQRAINQNPDFIYGDAIEDRHLKKARHHMNINYGMITHHQAMAYKAPLSHYDLNYKIAADYDLTFQIVKNSAHILYIPTALCLFESGGISQQKVRQGRTEQFKIRHSHNILPLENGLIFISQTLLYQLRRFSPRLYWLLKKR